MAIPLTLRLVKGSKLTFAELDNNFVQLRNAIGTLTDLYVTGGTYNPSTVEIDFVGNTGFNPFSVDVSGLLDTYVNNGVYDNNTGCVTFSTTSGYTFEVCGFLTGMTQYWTDGSSGNYSIKTINDSSVDATGDYAVAEGYNTIASGNTSHAEGYNTIAGGNTSHAEGFQTQALGSYTHAEGYGTVAGEYSPSTFGPFITSGITFTDIGGEILPYITGTYNVKAEAEDYEITMSCYNDLGETWPITLSGISGTEIFNADGFDITEIDGTDRIYFRLSGGWLGSTGYTEASFQQITSCGSDIKYAHSEGLNTSALGRGSHAEGSNTTASGSQSHAEGSNTTASGSQSHTEGSNTTASGNYSHAEGSNTTASGTYSHAEGYFTSGTTNGTHAEGWATLASGIYSHSEGRETISSGDYSHAEGKDTVASGVNSHAEGLGSVASGYGAHAEGFQTTASGDYSHTEGWQTIASASRAHAEGQNTTASGIYSHAEGFNTDADGPYSHAEGALTQASGQASHAEGRESVASGIRSHAEGYQTMATQEAAHAEGYRTTSSNLASHSEGRETIASGGYSHAEGQNTTASGGNSHSEGSDTLAQGVNSHAEGYYSRALGNGSHAEGGSAFVGGIGLTGGTAIGTGSHAEGVETTASGDYSHAEGNRTTASGQGSHSEGRDTVSSGEASHAEGRATIASGNYSHAEGAQTTASGERSHVEGSQNTSSGFASHAEGIGTQSSNNGSHAEGQTTNASGEGSHAEGQETQSIGQASHAENRNTIAYGFYSHAGGESSVASGYTSFIHSTNSLVTGDRSVVLGGQNITGTTSDTVYVPYLNINNLGTGTSINNLGIDTNGNIVVGSSGSTGTVGGSGTVNYVSRWTPDGTTLGDSVIQDDGSRIGVGVAPASVGGTYKMYLLTSNDSVGITSTQNTTTGTNNKTSIQALSTGSGGSGINIGVNSIASGSLTQNVGIKASSSSTGSASSLGGQFTATGGVNNYSVRLQDGTEDTGKFLKSVTANGEANWATITTSDVSGATSGSGTVNYVSKWTPDGTTLGDSLIQDDGSNMAIGSILGSTKFRVTSDKTFGLGIQQTVNGMAAQFYSTTSGASSNVGLQTNTAGSSTLNYGVQTIVNGTGTDESIGFVTTVSNGLTNYSAQLRDGTEGTGKFLKSVTANGKANWSNITASDITGPIFTGNTSGDCISDLYVSTIHSCSPLFINPSNEGDVYIGNNSVSVDITNDRVGIGTTTPTQTLDVSGNTKLDGDVTVTNNLVVQGNNTLNTINRQTYTFTTTGATPYVVGITAGVIRYGRYIKAIVIGNSTGNGSLGGEFVKFYDFDALGAGSTQLSSTGTLAENITTGTPTFSISDIAEFTATGVAATTIDWKVIIEYSDIS